MSYSTMDPPPCPGNFIDATHPRDWPGYWLRSDGTKPTGQPINNWAKDVHPWQSDRHGYFLGKHGLSYRHPNGITYRATGTDVFPPIH